MVMECPNCYEPYRAGEVNFCWACGHDLRDNVAGEIKEIAREPNPYEALRFMASLIIALGWVSIVVGWLFGSAFIFRAVIINDVVFTFVEPWMQFGAGIGGIFISTLTGVSLIASGQIYYVLLDLRNDTHVTMLTVRRIALGVLKKAS